MDRLKKHIRWFVQRKLRGFDDRDTWSLDTTIAKFVSPRLKRYRYFITGVKYPKRVKTEQVKCFPSQYEDKGVLKWIEDVDSMIVAFDLIQSDYCMPISTDAQTKIVDKGLEAFSKHLIELWW
jgi:hypothetical protein